MLTNGNEKLGIGIWNFNTPRHTCEETRTIWCDQYCRAKTNNFIQRWVIESMTRNYTESLMPDFVQNICKQICRNSVKYIMLHSCGDFYSNEYYLKWIEIAKRCPAVYMDAFTRNTEIDLGLCPPNLQIRFSVDYRQKQKINPTATKFAYVFELDRIPGHMEPFEDARFCNSKCYKCKYCFKGGGNVAFVINLSHKRASRNKPMHKDQLTLGV